MDLMPSAICCGVAAAMTTEVAARAAVKSLGREIILKFGFRVGSWSMSGLMGLFFWGDL